MSQDCEQVRSEMDSLNVDGKPPNSTRRQGLRLALLHRSHDEDTKRVLEDLTPSPCLGKPMRTGSVVFDAL